MDVFDTLLSFDVSFVGLASVAALHFFPDDLDFGVSITAAAGADFFPSSVDFAELVLISLVFLVASPGVCNFAAGVVLVFFDGVSGAVRAVVGVEG